MASEVRHATTYRERRLRKAESLREWAAKREQRANSASNRAASIADGIPFGQPILVGHHSERHHRRDLDRIHSATAAAVEHDAKAKEFTRRADGIQRAADRAIYSDDDDAAEQLKERIVELEGQRGRRKVINREIRRGRGWEARLEPPLTEAEREELLSAARFDGFRGYPPYATANLTANITRLRKRLQSLAATSVNPTNT